MIGFTILSCTEKMEDGFGMCSPGVQNRDSSLRDTFLPVIVGVIIVVNVGILTGVSRFG